jgi:hypothetical protein
MSQRDSGYERKERDLYETPEWVTMVVLQHLRLSVTNIWEPACGSGKMVRALRERPYTVRATDIETGTDFLKESDPSGADAIVTNPPYAQAYAFIVHAINLMEPVKGMVAMLLRTDFDHAKGRVHLFTELPFKKKVVLTKRIKWFEDSKGQPSFNHAWFIWDWKHEGPPTLAYGP